MAVLASDINLGKNQLSSRLAQEKTKHLQERAATFYMYLVEGVEAFGAITLLLFFSIVEFVRVFMGIQAITDGLTIVSLLASFTLVMYNVYSALLYARFTDLDKLVNKKTFTIKGFLISLGHFIWGDPVVKKKDRKNPALVNAIIAMTTLSISVSDVGWRLIQEMGDVSWRIGYIRFLWESNAADATLMFLFLMLSVSSLFGVKQIGKSISLRSRMKTEDVKVNVAQSSSRFKIYEQDGSFFFEDTENDFAQSYQTRPRRKGLVTRKLQVLYEKGDIDEYLMQELISAL